MGFSRGNKNDRQAERGTFPAFSQDGGACSVQILDVHNQRGYRVAAGVIVKGDDAF